MKVLITGAASGLGKALALLYAQNGAQICAVDLNQQDGQAVVDSIQRNNGEAFFLTCDITQQADVDRLAVEVEKQWGALDVLINNAGVATAGLVPFEDMETWQWVMDINLLGHVRMTKALLPFIQKSQASARAIINTASQAGLICAPGMGSYCASKAAMVSFSETLYLELAHQGIHVSVACPEFFDTNLNKSLRSNQPGMDTVVDRLVKNSGISADEIAHKIVKGVNAKEYMIVTHKRGRNAFRLKRFFPKQYFKKMKNLTARYTKPSASS